MDLIIFDLDCTLVDSRRDIATSVNELLNNLGRNELPNELIYSYIGNGVRRLLERCFAGIAPEELNGLVEKFLPIYRSHLLDTTQPYPGAREALQELARGPTLAVLSNKPQAESLAVLEGLDMASYFTCIYGGESFPKRKPDPIGIYSLLDSSGARPERSLMVGDSRVDFETARNASVPICMVSYGLGASEIAELDPDYVIDDLRQLIPLAQKRS